jgi:hypothetical protein
MHFIICSAMLSLIPAPTGKCTLTGILSVLIFLGSRQYSPDLLSSLYGILSSPGWGRLQWKLLDELLQSQLCHCRLSHEGSRPVWHAGRMSCHPGVESSWSFSSPSAPYKKHIHVNKNAHSIWSKWHCDELRFHKKSSDRNHSTVTSYSL